VPHDERANGSPNLLAVGHGQSSTNSTASYGGWRELLQSGDCHPCLRYGDVTHVSQAAAVACYKHDVRRGKYARFPRQYLHDELHLVKLKETKAQSAVGERNGNLSESRMREICTSGSMAGGRDKSR